MTDWPYGELNELSVQASTMAIALSGVACIYRWASAIENAAESGGRLAGLSEELLGVATGSVDTPSLLAAVVRYQAGAAQFVADPSTGELDDDEPLTAGKALVAEMILRADRLPGPTALAEWARWCSILALDFGQLVDATDISGPVSVSSEMTPFEAYEYAAQIETLREAIRTGGPDVSRLRLLLAEARAVYDDAIAQL